MRHILQTIKPYLLVYMIVVVDIDNPRSLWYLYDVVGKIVKRGYGDRHPGIGAFQGALRNANQAARRYVRKEHPLFFERRGRK